MISKINKSEILKLVSEFRRGMLNNSPPNSKCFMICFPLSGYLGLCGYEVELVKGEIEVNNDIHEHYWLQFKNGIIIDPTADQFLKPNGGNREKIYIGNKPDWYKLSAK